MTPITFLVQGSEPEPYHVTARRYGQHFRMTCTCRAGRFGTWCKHRADLIAGDHSAVVDPQPGDPERLAAMLQGTDAEATARHLIAALAQLDLAKQHADDIKKRFAALLNGPLD